MNKPAAKEPSMDEILSSIRQIIADEDEANRAAKIAAREAEAQAAAAAPAATPPAAEETPEPTALDVADEILGEAGAEDLDDEEPLTLSTEQLLSDDKPVEVELPEAFTEESAAQEPAAEGETVLTDLDEVTGLAADPTVQDPAIDESQLDQELEAPIVVPDDVSFADEPDDSMGADEPSVSLTPELPDPELTKNLAEELLEPAAGDAVRANFSRLNTLAMGNSDATLEELVKQMMRPMLKQWLDENLPGMVERVVEREIQRLSRGE